MEREVWREEKGPFRVGAVERRVGMAGKGKEQLGPTPAEETRLRHSQKEGEQVTLEKGTGKGSRGRLAAQCRLKKRGSYIEPVWWAEEKKVATAVASARRGAVAHSGALWEKGAFGIKERGKKTGTLLLQSDVLWWASLGEGPPRTTRPSVTTNRKGKEGWLGGRSGRRKPGSERGKRPLTLKR